MRKRMLFFMLVNNAAILLLFGNRVWNCVFSNGFGGIRFNVNHDAISPDLLIGCSPFLLSFAYLIFQLMKLNSTSTSDDIILDRDQINSSAPISDNW